MKLMDLLGEKLLQFNDLTNELSEIPTRQLDGKTVALYFSSVECATLPGMSIINCFYSSHSSAHWCPHCRDVTPKLATAFKAMNDEAKSKLEIVFISRDEDQASFEEYVKTMPWKALPSSGLTCVNCPRANLSPSLDTDRSASLNERFQIDGIPTLVIVSSAGDLITAEGVNELNIASERALLQWSQGKRLCWSRDLNQSSEEHAWKEIACTDCFMSPLMGTRRGCLNTDCHVDLCETCSPKTRHDHPLVEYLTPTRSYSLEQLFGTVPHLLAPNGKGIIATDTVCHDAVKSVGFYFSAHWCPPCRGFTPRLAELYDEAPGQPRSFEIVFVSCDHDQETFDEYRSEMPWPAVPLNAGALLKSYFQFSGK